MEPDVLEELRDAAVASATCICDGKCDCRASVELLNRAIAEIERLRVIVGPVDTKPEFAAIRQDLKSA